MIRNNNIGDLLTQIVNKPNNYVKSMICVVREYIEDGQTINVEPIDSEDYDLATPNTDNYINDVRLTAFQGFELDQAGYINIPKIDSYVIVSFIDNGDKFVSMFSQVVSFQVFTEGGSQLTMKQVDDLATNLLKGDRNTLISPYNYIGDNDVYYLEIDNAAESVIMASGNDIVIIGENDVSLYGKNQTNIFSDGKIVMEGDSDVEIKGSKIKIYNDITDLKTILSDLITTLNTNAVPDLTLPPPYGAGTGIALAADLVTLTTKINALLA